MSTLYITRGLPGCGKTYMASAWVAEDPENRARINRDDLRAMVHDSYYLAGVTEPRIIAVRDAAIVALLRKGVDVVCDDTNLPNRTVRDLMRLAQRAGADFDVWDLTDRPVDECIAHDSLRERSVGADVITGMYTRYLKGRSYPLPMPEVVEAASVVEPYVPKPGTPQVVLVDIDGTVALMNGRDPYDTETVDQDRPNYPVIEVVRALYHAGNRIVFMSGRSDECREATVEWLDSGYIGVPFDAVYMRKSGDYRKDSIVKAELFDEHIRDHYDVTCVLDDRNQVVEMWRSLGLTVLQVAPGDF